MSTWIADCSAFYTETTVCWLTSFLIELCLSILDSIHSRLAAVASPKAGSVRVLGQSLTPTYFVPMLRTSTYDHRVWRTGLPVRSAVLKPHAGKLVVRWVTTSESLLLYVFVFLFVHRSFSFSCMFCYSPPIDLARTERTLIPESIPSFQHP